MCKILSEGECEKPLSTSVGIRDMDYGIPD
jgi:hypothetical protein